MLHGLGDCTPVLNCGCIGTGDARRPPSRAVIEAVERAMLGHVLCDCLPDSATRAEMRDHVHGEVARAAEAAALKVAAERMHDLSRESAPLMAVLAARSGARRLNRWADELTDTDDRSE